MIGLRLSDEPRGALLRSTTKKTETKAMFTIKYRYYTLTQQAAGVEFICYDENESLHGPYEVVSQSRENGDIAVTCIPGPNNLLPMTFGPFVPPSDAPNRDKHPRPTIWVMNEGGATVARYDL